MNREYKGYKRLIKYFILALFVFYFFVLLLFLYREEYDRNINLREIKLNERNMMTTYSQLIAKEISSISSDLKFLEQTYTLDLDNRMEIENQWFLFCKNKHIYDQIRYIDKFGDEKIKVTYNYGSNESRRIDDINLRNRSEDTYVKETFKLEKNQIYISQLDLKTDFGKVEEPKKPIIRVSTPVYDRSGNLEGMIILNYLAENIIDELENISKFSNGQTYLLNKDGYFLYSDDNEEEWGFMYDDKKDISFKEKFKAEWNMMEEGKRELLTGQGLFIVSKIELEGMFKYDKKNVVRNRTIVSDNNWLVVSFMDRNKDISNTFNTTLFARIKKITEENIFYFINIIFLAIIIAFLVFITHNSYLKTKFLSQYDSMTGTLNRRAGFLRLKEDLEVNLRYDRNMCICFIDVNGLKEVNDILGHGAGDELILTAIDIIKATIRDSDYIMRTGGDEFLIIFNNIDRVRTEMVWDRIKSQFVKINREEDREYIISISHGVVEVDRSKNLSVEELVFLADERMYIEKRSSKEKENIIKSKIMI